MIINENKLYNGIEDEKYKINGAKFIVHYVFIYHDT